MTEPTPWTDLIESARSGDSDAVQRLWQDVYEEMRRLAQRAIAREHQPLSVQATDLAHEAYIRLAGQAALVGDNRGRLLAMVARAMRRLLIDRARARQATKRGGAVQRLVLDDVLDSASFDLDQLLDVDTALTKLEATDPRLAQLVELRFFSGLTLDDAADALRVSRRTAAGDWALAKAWLKRELGKGME